MVSPEASAQTSLLIPLIFTFTLVIQTVLIPHFQNLRGDRYLTPEEKAEKLARYLCRRILLQGSCYAKRLVGVASARVGKRLVVRHRSASTLIIYLVSNIADRSFTKCDRPTTDISFLYWLPD
ncbi:MAG: hypothetical protein V7K88_12530 [Nostoc sp.]|uniref:hypothetical protein n=1 Tax=Nostoc sp. TaxID=1180 RepID=UPI002FF9AAAB